MISPEVLRRHTLFSLLHEAELKDIAMIAKEESFEKGATLFEECEPAQALHLLLEGSVDMSYRVEADSGPEKVRFLPAGEINPGEVFALSALVEPYVLNATARAAQKCHVLKIDAPALRQMLDANPDLGYRLMKQLARAVVERLINLRVQISMQ